MPARSCLLTVTTGLILVMSAPAAAVEIVGERDNLDEPFVLQVTGLGLGSAERVQPFTVDRDGTELDSGSLLSSQLRLGAIFDVTYKVGKFPFILHGELEGDAVGADGGSDIEGTDLPTAGDSELIPRKAFARLSFGPVLTIGGGLTTSSWGLGLLANSGDKVWQPGSARFVDPRGGDIVNRLLVATGPWGPFGAQAFGFVDKVEDDDTLVEGDEAEQFGGGLVVGQVGPSIGFYFVQREVTAIDGDFLDVRAFDTYARLPIELDQLKLTLETEVAYIIGETSLAPTVEFAEHDVEQLGVAVRFSAAGEGGGAVVDFLYASGDQNLDDGAQNAFKADPNYEMGLMLFRHVVAGQTGRAPVTASDLDLIGVPSEDLDRFPTRGGPSNTVAVFPRGWLDLGAGFELYGGPLLAWSAVDVVDPLNTRFAGGKPTNALAGRPGRYLGTELDLGLRSHHELGPVEVSAGLEGGILFLGRAFIDDNGQTDGTLFGGRAMAQFAF